MELIEIVAFFRQELEIASKEEKVAVQLKHFPNGSCEISSVLLGNYLLRKGFNVQIVRAYKTILDDMYNYEVHKKIGHAWLIVNQEIVDITGDQFKDFDDSTFIGKSSKFHAGFTVKSQKFDSSDCVKPEYNSVYQKITSEINRHTSSSSGTSL